MKLCTKCGETKVIANFGVRGPGSRPNLVGKPYSTCRSCRSLARRVWNRGITEADLARMMEEQQGRCYLCDAEDQKLQVDHSHTSGAIRKLLCNNCNWRVGMLEKLPTGWLSKALTYITTFS